MVAASAMTMPATPKTQPCFAVSCLLRPAKDRMNSSAATRYAAVAIEAADTSVPLAEHGEHAAGHREAAEDVDGGQQQRDPGQDLDRSHAEPDLDQRARSEERRV